MERKGLMTTAGRSFYFYMDTGTKISEGTYYQEDFESNDLEPHNYR